MDVLHRFYWKTQHLIMGYNRMKFTKYETCAICTETLFVLYAHNIGSKENTNIVDILLRDIGEYALCCCLRCFLAVWKINRFNFKIFKLVFVASLLGFSPKWWVQSVCKWKQTIAETIVYVRHNVCFHLIFLCLNYKWTLPFMTQCK